MKRILSLLLTAVLLSAVLPACQRTAARSNPPERQPTASEVVSAMLPASGYTGRSENLEYLTKDAGNAELLDIYLENAYGMTDGSWEDAAIIRAAGASAFELTVLRLKSGAEAARTAALLASYLNSREGDFAGYAPEQAELVANADIAQQGSYVALCICPDPERAAEAFFKSVNGGDQAGFGLLDILPARPARSEPPVTVPPEQPARSEPPVTAPPGQQPSTPEPQETEYSASYPGRCRFVQPNVDDMSIYDTSAILAAWKSGSPASLSGYDKDIYYAAQSVLNAVLKDGMSDLEKEIAVYGWIVTHVNYDWTHQDVLRETPRESFTPYGGLVNHTAVCLGYATTFQLLMDLSGVECITVAGAAFDSLEDHAWNMVRLNGKWYCLDVTWDANYREYGYNRGRERDWRYFNITSDEMALTDHQWDYAHIPEAVTRGNGRG